MKDPEKRPNLGSGNLSVLKLADNCANVATVLDGLGADESRRGQSILEGDCVVCGARAVQEVAEVSKQGVAPSLRDYCEAIAQRRESVWVLEISPTVLDCFLALFICGADSECALDLTGEFPDASRAVVTHN